MAGDQFNPQQTSTYSQYLPALLQEQDFLGRFLLAFEQVLSGLPADFEGVSAQKAATKDGTIHDGFEETIDRLHTYLNPERTPTDFLPWLAGWVALGLRDDWSESTQRNFIRRILSLYKIRGTKKALEEILKIYLHNTQETVRIYEFENPAHYFQVELELSTPDLVNYRRKERVARAIIDLEKPAHTFYSLRILMPTMQLVSKELAEDKKTERLVLRTQRNAKDNNPTVLGTSKHSQRPLPDSTPEIPPEAPSTR